MIATAEPVAYGWTAEPITVRLCTSCREPKALDEFPRRRGGLCRECQCERHRRYREQKREEIREQKRRKREQKRDEILEQERRYREGNRDEARERSRRYRATLAARPDEQIAADQARLRPHGRKACRSCRETLDLGGFAASRYNADGLAHDCRRCRAEKKTARLQAPAALLSASGCYVCQEPITGTPHVEHIVPRRRGGDDSPANLAFACEACNLAKNAADPGPWLRDRMGEAEAWDFLAERVSSRVLIHGADLVDAP